MAMSQVIRETMESYQEAAVKALTVAENEAARDVDKVVGAYTRLYRRGYADGYADAKKGNPSHVVDAEAAAIGESISLDRCVCPNCGQPHDPKLVCGGPAMSADAGTERGDDA